MAVALLVGMLAFCAVARDQAYASKDGYPVVVSMGDSYSSGEGTEPFFEQGLPDLEKFDKEDFLAHRSEHAWSGQLVVDGTKLYDYDNHTRSPGWYFTAVSGAQTKNILTDKQWIDYSATPGILESRRVGTYACDPQIEVFEDNDLQGAVDYVTLSIGGNDTPDDKELGFVNIVKAAAWDNRFTHGGALESILEEEKSYFNDTMKGNLLNAYGKILEKAGSQAKLVVAGYPHLFSSQNGLGIYVSAEDAQKINALIDYFDETMTYEITKLDSVEFADPRSEFSGHESEYINGVIVGRSDQELWDVKFPPISSYSVHPNAKGQEAYARVVQRVIDKLEKEQGIENVDIASNVNMSLVFDVSGSMEEYSGVSGVTKLESAKRQTKDFVSAIRGSGGADGMSVKVGIASFSTVSELECGLSNDPNEINAAIDSLTAYGRTNIFAGLDTGIKQLESDEGEKLMVFLSDGLSNEGPDSEAILTLAQDAADAGIRVYTIGFGPSSEIDEELLRQIASITGGAYSHEDSSDIMSAAVGLFATMMDAHLSSTSQVLTSGTGTVQQGGTASMGSFDVSGNGTLKTYLYWPGSVLDMQLTDPDGVLVDSSYAGCVFDDSTIPTTITVSNAKQGTWQMAVYGAEVSMENEPFYAAASLDAAQQAAPTGGGGGAANGGEGLLFLFIVLAVACIVGVFAFSRRRGSRG